MWGTTSVRMGMGGLYLLTRAAVVPACPPQTKLARDNFDIAALCRLYNVMRGPTSVRMGMHGLCLGGLCQDVLDIGMGGLYLLTSAAVVPACPSYIKLATGICDIAALGRHAL